MLKSILVIVILAVMVLVILLRIGHPLFSQDFSATEDEAKVLREGCKDASGCDNRCQRLPHFLVKAGKAGDEERAKPGLTASVRQHQDCYCKGFLIIEENPRRHVSPGIFSRTQRDSSYLFPRGGKGGCIRPISRWGGMMPSEITSSRRAQRGACKAPARVRRFSFSVPSTERNDTPSPGDRGWSPWPS